MTYYYTTQHKKDDTNDQIIINVYSHQDIESKTVSEEPIATLEEAPDVEALSSTGFIKEDRDQKLLGQKHDFDLNESFKKQRVTVEKLEYLVSSFALASVLVTDAEATIRQYLNLDKKAKLVKVDL